MRRLASLALLLGLLLLLPLQGCSVSYNGGVKAQRTVQQTVDHISDAGLFIKTRNGSIDVIASDEWTNVSIEAVITCKGATQAEADQRLAATSLGVSRRTDRTLIIEPIFPGERRSGDGAKITVRLPQAVGVELRTSNGGVNARNLAGRLFIDTSNGPVNVVDQVGPVEIDTSNGGVDVRGLAGAATVDTSNGPVMVQLLHDQAGPLNIDTSNGSITVHVGPAFEGKVALDTSNGRLKIEDPGGRIASRKLDKTEGTITVGEGGATSRIDTSNGSITFVIEG